MSTDVEVQTLIRRPRSQVAAYAMDWRNERAWIGALTDVRLVTGEPFGVGSQVARTASFLGKRIEYVNEVVELVPDARLVMRSVKAPFPMTVVYEFDDVPDGTRFRIRNYGDATGFYRATGRILAAAVRRGVARDLRRLKALLEAGD